MIMNMKQIIQIVRYALVAIMLTSTSYVTGQVLDDSDYPYICGYDEPYSGYSPRPWDFYPIQLYPILDRITIRKVPEMQEEELETLVKTYLPDAVFDWKTYVDNVCMVINESDISDDVIDGLLKEDAITFLYRTYTRKTYMDLMEIYPVKEISVYGFVGRIHFSYRDIDIIEKADSLINSKGLVFVYDRVVTVSKNMDIIAVANEIYESEYFYESSPIRAYGTTKILNTQPIDKSTLPFYYNNSGNNQYLYELYDRFMVRKSSTMSKSALESVIKGQLEKSEIIWENDSICTVLTIKEEVEGAMEAIQQKDGVLRVSHEYFDVEEYEDCLKKGVKNPYVFGLTGEITTSFKDNITETDKTKIINDYNLRLVKERKNGNEYDYYCFEVPKTSDILTVSKRIFETGMVKYSVPITTLNIPPHHNSTGGSTTIVKEAFSDNKETGTLYYNISGKRIDTPAGLTIVVTRYSDGTVRTEKRLFR